MKLKKNQAIYFACDKYRKHSQAIGFVGTSSRSADYCTPVRVNSLNSAVHDHVCLDTKTERGELCIEEKRLIRIGREIYAGELYANAEMLLHVLTARGFHVDRETESRLRSIAQESDLITQ